MARVLTSRLDRWSALLLGIYADLSGTLATFLPMKSIFVLAADDVPSFFPQFLIASGPVSSALALVALAAFLAVTSGLASRGVLDLQKQEAGGKGNPLALFVAGQSSSPLRARSDRTLDIALVAIMAAIVGVASWVFLGLTLVWLLVLVLALSYYLQKRPRQAPFASGVEELAHRTAHTLQNVGLWSSVIIALVSLLLYVPPLGLTGILLAAVFGRRLQQIAGRLVNDLPGAISTAQPLQSSLSNLVTNVPEGQSLSVAYDFLTSRVGRRRFGDFLRARELGRDDFRLMGQPSRETVSLLLGTPDSSVQSILRLFTIGHEDKRDAEVHLRSQEFPYTISASKSLVESLNVVGFPSLLVTLHTPNDLPDVSNKPSLAGVVSWQIGVEKRGVLEGQDINRAADVDEIQQFLQTLTRQLEGASLLPGPHQEGFQQLLAQLPERKPLLRRLPQALIPERPLNEHDFYLTRSGTLCLLTHPGWKIGRPGQTWGRFDHYSAEWLRVTDDLAPDDDLRHGPILHAHCRRLGLSLTQRSLVSAQAHAESLLKFLGDQPS